MGVFSVYSSGQPCLLLSAEALKCASTQAETGYLENAQPNHDCYRKNIESALDTA